AQRHLDKSGFECRPFLVGWYNSLVEPVFRLTAADGSDLPEDAVALCVLSRPDMFELCLLPRLAQQVGESGDEIDYRDPIDTACSLAIRSALDCLSEADARCRQRLLFFDYDIQPGSRAPRVLVQTAGHVSGCAHFYPSRRDTEGDTDRLLYGASLHPVHGGWFGFRAVAVLPDLRLPDLPRPSGTSDPLGGRPDLELDFLRKFNGNWRDNLWRDCLPAGRPARIYAPEFVEYLNTRPSQRSALVQQWRSEGRLIKAGLGVPPDGVSK
ncbi:hypothetical protein BOX15_Mlig004726g1, partial [Macrostomum lignano]